MINLERLVRDVRRYGETKRGHDGIRYLVGPRGLRVEAFDGTRAKTAEMSKPEMDRLGQDRATARACDVVDRLLHELRELRNDPAQG